MRPVVGTTYLVHFDRPIGSAHPRGQAQHYIGWSSDEQARLEAHADGRGAKIMAAVFAAGVGARIVRVWHRTTRATERRIKNWHKARVFCPVCCAAPREIGRR